MPAGARSRRRSARSTAPNITPDPETGIGRWTDAQFLRALRDGVRADGANYFPVFPYPSFTGITDEDALAIKAYLFSLPPVRQPNRPHDVSFPFSWRCSANRVEIAVLRRRAVPPGTGPRAPVWNRGAYLVTALAHCGECHTPRNWFGAMEPSRFLAGNAARAGRQAGAEHHARPKDRHRQLDATTTSSAC